MKFKQSWLNWRTIIIEDNRLSFYAKALGLYLNTFMNDSHDMAFPSLRRIEVEMSMSRKTVIKYLGELETMGYIKKGKILSPSTSQYHNTYTALIPDEINPIKGGGSHTPPCEKVVDLRDEGGGSQGQKVVDHVHPNKQRNKQRNKQVEKWAIPEWINPNAWQDFEQHRKEIRKPLTDLARTKAVNKLKGFSFAEQQSAIDNSIQSRWAGIFPKKLNGGGDETNQGIHESNHARVMRRLSEKIANE